MTLSKMLGSATIAVVLAVSTLAAEGTPFVETITVQGVAGTVRGGKNDHYLTFSSPVSLPGVTLGPGTYIFRRPATDILQVLRAEGRQPLVMVTTQVVPRKGLLHQYQVILRRNAVADAAP